MIVAGVSSAPLGGIGRIGSIGGVVSTPVVSTPIVSRHISPVVGHVGVAPGAYFGLHPEKGPFSHPKTPIWGYDCS